MEWLSAVVAAVIALAGVVLTQWNANRREDARWRRERSREEQQRVQEEATRTFEHRCEAYVQFLEEWYRFADLAFDYWLEDGPEPPEDSSSTIGSTGHSAVLLTLGSTGPSGDQLRGNITAYSLAMRAPLPSR